MPLYDFTNEHGQARTFMCPPQVRELQQDGHTWRRDAVQRFGVLRGVEAPGQAGEVLAGYRRQEEKHGSRFRSRHSARAIKAAWG